MTTFHASGTNASVEVRRFDGSTVRRPKRPCRGKERSKSGTRLIEISWRTPRFEVAFVETERRECTKRVSLHIHQKVSRAKNFSKRSIAVESAESLSLCQTLHSDWRRRDCRVSREVLGFSSWKKPLHLSFSRAGGGGRTCAVFFFLGGAGEAEETNRGGIEEVSTLKAWIM